MFVNQEAVDVAWWRRREQATEPTPDPVTARMVLTRLDSVVDRLEGVYERLAPLIEQPVKPPPKDPEN